MKFEEIFRDAPPVFLAPMAGVTDAPFRKLVESLGVTATVSEMISSEALTRNSAKTFRRIESDAALKIVQIMGADPERMAESAVINENFGASVIDINFGCPARKIVSNESGSALMKDEDLAVRIAEKVIAAVKIPVTIKMRLGWDSENINCFSLAKKFEDVGVKMVTVHCRTRNQMYSGKADWSLLRKMSDIIKIPYICNGDIKTPEDAMRALAESGANGVMVGRAALGRPWLLNQIMQFLKNGSSWPKSTTSIPTPPPSFPPSRSEIFEIVDRHFEDVIKFYGEIHGLRIFRKHFCWYTTGMRDASIFREKINKVEDISLARAYIREFFAGDVAVAAASLEDSSTLSSLHQPPVN